MNAHKLPTINSMAPKFYPKSIAPGQATRPQGLHQRSEKGTDAGGRILIARMFAAEIASMTDTG